MTLGICVGKRLTGIERRPLAGCRSVRRLSMRFDRQTLSFDVAAPTYLENTNTVSMHRDQHGNPYLYLDFSWLTKDAPTRFGAALLRRVSRASCSRSRRSATRPSVGATTRRVTGKRIMDCYAWPRYGFDGQIMMAKADRFPYFPKGVTSGAITTRPTSSKPRAAGNGRAKDCRKAGDWVQVHCGSTVQGRSAEDLHRNGP
ncbi:hypothetical protein DP57_5953 [Burkholderia pseudomallei]|nr:hypothetical protein DP57_5953 [Burkholderia pseudomallei]